MMTKFRGFIFLISLCCSAAMTGQTTLNRREPPVAEYVLGAGDQVSVQVTDMNEITDKPLRIDPNGFIDLPLAGRVQAGGLTLNQLKAEVAQRLSKYITAPEVSINLAGNESRPVSVIGAVANSGVHQMGGPKRLLEVISLSGGIRPDAGPKVIVTRQAKWGKVEADGVRTELSNGYSSVTLPLDALMAAKNPAQNIMIEPGDVISIPKAELIYVVGNVRKAGGFQLSTHETLSLLQALSLAEGFTPDAAGQRSRILRQPQGGDGKPYQIEVDADKILKGQSPDVPLYANDVLFIPNSATKAAAKRMLEAAIGVTTGLVIYRR